jgi:hypothetical protein
VQTFDHELWAKHRSTSRYWRHISSMTRSRVVKALAVPMVGWHQHRGGSCVTYSLTPSVTINHVQPLFTLMHT